MRNPLLFASFIFALLFYLSGKLSAQDTSILDDNVLVFSTIRGSSSKPDTAVLVRKSRPGENFTIGIVGDDARYFKELNSFAGNESENSTISVVINFVPGDEFVGLAKARLVMRDTNSSELDFYDLRGLCIPALEGANEPSLALVTEALGYGIDIGWSSLANHTRPELQGSQISNTLFRKAGEGRIDIRPVARYSPPFPLPFGFYTLKIDGPELNEVGILANSEEYPEHQALFPGISEGATSFDPGEQTFGFYTQSPTHTAFSQDFWNRLYYPSYVSDATRIYPLTNRDGKSIDHAYLLCFEEAQNGDYQDYVFVLTNVEPVPDVAMESSAVILDASDFLDEIPGQHQIVDTSQIGVPWLFNNLGLLMTTRSNYLRQVEIKEDGTYYLYTHSHGRPGTTFRVAIDDQVTEMDLGRDSMVFEKAGIFELRKGTADVRIMRIENNPVLDFLVLSKRPDLNLSELEHVQWDDEVVLLKEYVIPNSSCVKFGDVTSDGQMDMMVLTRDYSAYVLDYDGNTLWNYVAPEEGSELRRSFEAPGLIWDLDQDGAAEVIHWRQDPDQSEWLVIANGQTGEIINRCLWPTRSLPHEYNNFRLAIGRLEAGHPRHILVFTDMGGTISIAAYDAQLEQLWLHEETKKKDHLGHYIYPTDLDKDGIDEVVASGLVLDADGREIWNAFELFYDHHDHADSYRFADLDDDGKIEMVSAHSDAGVFAYDALSGELKWQNIAEHTQQLEIGKFLSSATAPQVVVGARTYGDRRFGIPYLWSQVHWLSNDGQLLFKWPANPLNGNPVFVKGDWYGDGEDILFWFKFRMRDNGKGKLYFGEPVYHMFDFLGGAAEEVITLYKDKLRIYGSKSSLEEQNLRTKTPEYLKSKVSNHTHY